MELGDVQLPSASEAANARASVATPPRSSPRATLETYRELIELSLDAALLVNGAGTILLANERAASLFAYARDELRGRALSGLIAARERAERLRVSATGTSGLQRIGGLQVMLGRRSDGSELPLEVERKSLPGEGAPSVVIVRDLSERERLMERVVALQRMEVVGRVAAGVAHDFNNLLTVILGFGSCVLDALPEGEGSHADMLELMAAAERARSLAGRLLGFTRHGRPERAGVVDVGGVVTRLERMLRHLLGGTVQYDLRVQPGLWPVRVDEASIEQVILNLTLNAKDAMPHGGALRIAVDNSREVEARADAREPARRDHVILSVSDTGHGMGPDTQRRIFEPFFTTKALGSGTGLGLAMASSIVAEAGGFIRVQSEPGRGTTFAVHLPRALHESEPVYTGALLSEAAQRHAE